MENLKSTHILFWGSLTIFLNFSSLSIGRCGNHLSSFHCHLHQVNGNFHFDVNMANIHSLDTLPFNLRSRQSISTPKKLNASSLLPESAWQRITYECDIVFDGRDPVTGNRKKELAYDPLFSYTSSHIKPYLPGKDLLEAECKLFRFNGGYTYLDIKFHWNARNPRSHYGRLKSNGAIRFYLTDKKSITLYNNQESNWQLDSQSDTYILQSLFLLHPKQIKLLKKEVAMKAVVYWERGFEEYPIYPITIFKNQLSCLE